MPRGEAGRVAARVRALLAEAEGHPGDDVRPAVAPFRDALADEGASTSDERQLPGGPGRAERFLARVPLRLDPGRRAALAVGVAVLLAAVVTGVWLVSSRPQAVPVAATAPVVPSTAPLVGSSGAAGRSSSGPSSNGSSGAAATPVVVDVAGKVEHPGVYRLPAGARVNDALRAAGGPVGHVDLTSLNLAALLVDGQQVAVGVAPAAGAGGTTTGGSGASGSGGSAGGLVNLNTATLEQLETLPGVGPVLAQDILDYRSAHGSFSSVDQLQDVTGIGDVKYGALKSRVSV